MGRRAADLATPVPVSEVPALVGVRDWRTANGEAELTCAHQCNVGVQTSPAIRSCQDSRPVIQAEKRTTMPPNGHIPVEVEGRKGQKRSALFKHRSLDNKVKKGVTFHGVDNDNDVDGHACKGNKAEMHCDSQTIQTNPHRANGRVKGKKEFRFTNGSVVDSEVIGGISSDISEGELTPQLKTTVHSGKGKVPPCSPPHRFPLRICSKCGGRQNPVAAVLFTTSRDTISPCSADSESLRSSPAARLVSGKETGASLSPPNNETEKYGVMQTNRGPAVTWPPPNPDSTQLLSSKQEGEAVKLSKHQSSWRYAGLGLPHIHRDSPVSHASSAYTYTVAGSAIQETGMHTHADLCSYKLASLSHTVTLQEPRPSMLTPHPQPYSSLKTDSQSITPKDTNSTPKKKPNMHSNILTHTSHVALTNHANIHPKSSATVHSPIITKDQRLGQSAKLFGTSPPSRDVQVSNGLETVQSKHSRPSSCSHANPSTKPQSTLQIHSSTHPKPTPSTDKHQPMQTPSPTGTTSSAVSLCTALYSKPSMPLHCSLPHADIRQHSILNNQQSNPTHTSNMNVHTSASLSPCPATTLSLLTQANTVTITQAFMEMHSYGADDPKPDTQSQSLAQSEVHVRSVPEKLEDKVCKSSPVGFAKSPSKVATKTVTTTKIDGKFVTDTDGGSHVQANCELLATSKSQTVHQQSTPQHPANPEAPIAPHEPNSLGSVSCQPPRPFHPHPLHPAIKLLIEVTGNKRTNIDSKPNPFLLSSSMPSNQIQNTQLHQELETASQTSIVLPVSGPVSNGGYALTHYHPPSLVLLSRSSPESNRSQNLQKRLETVEANLQAKQERVTTLLNIIQDLEMSHALSKG